MTFCTEIYGQNASFVDILVAEFIFCYYFALKSIKMQNVLCAFVTSRWRIACANVVRGKMKNTVQQFDF